MKSLKSIRLDLAAKLKDKAYRSAFFRAWAQDEVALQIKSLRKLRKLRQVDIAAQTGMKQSAVSRLEQAEYSRWNFYSLLRLAEALDSRVRVILEPAEDVIAQYERSEKNLTAADTMETFQRQTQLARENVQQKENSMRLGVRQEGIVGAQARSSTYERDRFRDTDTPLFDSLRKN